jgi:hypothetical protein
MAAMEGRQMVMLLAPKKVLPKAGEGTSPDEARSR